MEIRITTESTVPDMKAKNSYERVEVSAPTLSKAEAKLIRKVAKVSDDINWIIDVKYYQRPNRKFLMSGTPVVMEE